MNLNVPFESLRTIQLILNASGSFCNFRRMVRQHRLPSRKFSKRIITCGAGALLTRRPSFSIRRWSLGGGTGFAFGLVEAGTGVDGTALPFSAPGCESIQGHIKTT